MTARLYIAVETHIIGLVGLPVVHESLWEVIRRFMSPCVVSRCTSIPERTVRVGKKEIRMAESPLKIGHKYVCINPSRDNLTKVLYPKGQLWQCKACSRWTCSQGPGGVEPYACIPEPQGDDAVYFDQRSGSLLVTPVLRKQIDAINLSPIGWKSVPIFSEPLPHHVPPPPTPPPPPPEPPRIVPQRHGPAVNGRCPQCGFGFSRVAVADGNYCNHCGYLESVM